MTKAEFISRVASSGKFTKAEAEKVVGAFLEAMEDGLAKEGKITLKGFGTFEVKKREKRMGRHPGTGEPLEIPASNVVVFRAAEPLKKSVNK